LTDWLVITAGATFATLLLEFKENLRETSLTRAWHDGGGFVRELQEQDPLKLMGNVFKPLVNVEMNAYILANSGRGGRTARGPRAGRGRGRPAKGAYKGKGQKKGRFSSKFYIGKRDTSCRAPEALLSSPILT